MSESFTDLRLTEDSHSTLKLFCELNFSDGAEGRPAKRRRTKQELPEDINITAYEQLVMFLNGSVLESPVLNLTNLYNVVQ